MSEKLADRFVAALGELEAARDDKDLIALFADDCEIGNVVATDDFHGTDGAREFWKNYRATFGEVKSEFRNRIVTDNRVALEWMTTGTSQNGDSVTYEGVSILELDGDKITRFFAYFDPAKLGKQIVDSEGAENARDAQGGR